MIVGTFILLWTPGTVSFFIMAVTENRDFSVNIFKISTTLVHFNSTVDPIIYAYRMNNIREGLKKLFKIRGDTNSIASQSSSSHFNASTKTIISHVL